MAGSPLSERLRNRAERLRQHRWRMAAYRSSQRHIVLGGAPRSGTTLLRRLLDRHPGICAGPETKLFVPAAFNLAWLAEAYALPRAELEGMRHTSTSQAAFIDAFAARVTAMADKSRWAEKTPQNIRHLDWIMERFPGASVIHIVRDGRDVVCSMRQHPDWRWRHGAWQKVLVARPLRWYAQRWLADTGVGMAWREDPRYVELRYEDLVADFGTAIRAVCEAIGERADADWLAMVSRREEPTADGQAGSLRRPEEGISGPREGRPDYEGPISDASVGRWRTGLAGDDLQEILRLCGERLAELGYEV